MNNSNTQSPEKLEESHMPFAGTDHNLNSEPATPPRKDPLAALYEKNFAVVPATTSELLQEVHRLRYQVYCVENEFESAEQNPHGLEIDEYDARSAHSLLFHRPSQKFIGTARLILPNAANPDRSFPFQRVCDEPLFSAASSAEISRFCISKELRQLAKQTAANEPDQLLRPQHLMPFVTLGLMRGLVQMSVENRITHWCILVEQPFLRFIGGLGVHFQQFGPLVEHHGKRQPCYSNIHIVLSGIRRERPEVWDVITNSGKVWPAEHAIAPRAEVERHVGRTSA